MNISKVQNQSMLRDWTAVGSHLDRAEVIWLANYLSLLNRHSVIVVLDLVWLYIAKGVD